jgi:hypothetical protein
MYSSGLWLEACKEVADSHACENPGLGSLRRSKGGKREGGGRLKDGGTERERVAVYRQYAGKSSRVKGSSIQCGQRVIINEIFKCEGDSNRNQYRGTCWGL